MTLAEQLHAKQGWEGPPLETLSYDELKAEGMRALNRFGAVLAAMEDGERREKQRIHAGLKL